MILIPLVSLFVGVLLGWLVKSPVRGEMGTYIAVSCLAGLDSVCGGLRATIEGKFANDVFVTGFFANVLIASFLAWLGDRIGIDIFLVCALIFGTRIFNNLSLLRRYGLSRWQDRQARRRLEEEQARAQAQPAPSSGATAP